MKIRKSSWFQYLLILIWSALMCYIVIQVAIVKTERDKDMAISGIKRNIQEQLVECQQKSDKTGVIDCINDVLLYLGREY